MDGISHLSHLQSVTNMTPESITAARAGEKDISGEFESVFVSMLLKSMRETMSEGGLFKGDSTDSMGAMFDLYMGKHLADGDTFGIRTMMKEYLKGTGNDDSIQS